MIRKICSIPSNSEEQIQFELEVGYFYDVIAKNIHNQPKVKAGETSFWTSDVRNEDVTYELHLLKEYKKLFFSIVFNSLVKHIDSQVLFEHLDLIESDSRLHPLFSSSLKLLKSIKASLDISGNPRLQAIPNSERNRLIFIMLLFNDQIQRQSDSADVFNLLRKNILLRGEHPFVALSTGSLDYFGNLLSVSD